MIFHCCSEERRDALLDHPSLNGLDNVEVVDDPSQPAAQRQRTLIVRFVNPVTAMLPAQFRIEGGVRIPEVQVSAVDAGDGDPDGQTRSLRLTLDSAGDFSLYVLRIVVPGTTDVPPGIDPLLSRIEFSFKASCQSDVDCAADAACPPTRFRPPEQGYLARDFNSFRRLLLDHVAIRSPDWHNQTPADLGVTLVELLAYVGDKLAYRQDAVGTEAYLETARLRQSVRRHVRLVDYFVHEGCNSRVWIQIDVRDDVSGQLLSARHTDVPTRVLTRVDGLPDQFAPDSDAWHEALVAQAQVFELLHDIELHAAHNRMGFYTWGADACCLPLGATRATLRGSYPNLAAGDVVILAETVGATTGVEADADPERRHAVRLTAVTASQDPLGGRFENPPNDDPVDVTEIAWSDEDALPFPLCVSARIGVESEPVGFALGNVVAADHGLSIDAETLPAVPPADPLLTRVTAATAPCDATTTTTRAPRYRPPLSSGPLVWAAPFDRDTSATATLAAAPELALPQLWLDDSDGENWEPSRDLLAHTALERVYVVEMSADGSAALRFGDGNYGARPAAGLSFDARYRIGHRGDGRIGRDTLQHLVSADPLLSGDPTDPIVQRVRNWMPAQGGVDAEPVAEVRAKAPHAFRTQERAVTAEDYGNLARRLSSVQRVQATPRWTGSWHTMFVSVDRTGGLPVDTAFQRRLNNHLQAFRLAGQDLEIDSPVEVALDIELEVCVAPGHFPDPVRRALLAQFHNGVDDAGEPALFHPDRFSFGEPVYLSPLVAAAQSTPGVASIRVSRFQRFGEGESDGREAGFLPMARLEIARLDNDPNFPEHGVFNLIMQVMQ